MLKIFNRAVALESVSDNGDTKVEDRISGISQEVTLHTPCLVLVDVDSGNLIPISIPHEVNEKWQVYGVYP